MWAMVHRPGGLSSLSRSQSRNSGFRAAVPDFMRPPATLIFPKRNDFGKAFKDAGFKFPVDDEGMLKVPPVMLGAPAQKETFPHSIWPGTIPGMPPIGLRMNTFFQKTSGNRGRFDSLVPPGTVAPFIPKTDLAL